MSPMTKGLKQMVAEATEEKPAPVEITGDVLRVLSEYTRKWSGWPDSRIEVGDPREHGVRSPWAATYWDTHKMVVNIDHLILNPNRVLFTVTPFRLRQEAVLTGTLLHESGHVRFTRWLPRTDEQAAAFKHSDGTVPTPQTVALARTMEEARVEARMTLNAERIGAASLEWTMRASAAHLMPMTSLSADPNQAIMDLITSWTLRAGRQYGLNGINGHPLRHWVQDFTSLLSSTIIDHLTAYEEAGADILPTVQARQIVDLLIKMTHCDDDTGPTMIDTAREVLGLLFPETPEADQPTAGGDCGDAADPSESEEGDDGEGSESGAGGQGNTEPEDEGEGTDPGAGDAGEPDEEGQNGAEADENGAPEDAEPEGDTEGQSEPDEPAESDEGGEDDGATASTDAPDNDAPDNDAPDNSALAKALREMEARAGDETEDEAQAEADGKGGEDPEADDLPSMAGGKGLNGGHGDKGFRSPGKSEREVQKGAERFLREMIDPSEASKRTLDDAPAPMVDGAAMAAWKAGGQHLAPKFFVRTRRTTEPSPPIKIAILVDVSYSMSELQKPSALLSWALGAAALDLRNFAGRGQQVESCMIHWGDDARVIQRPGEMLPGIREWRCDEGTSAMGEALALVEQQMPGFFDITERPVNRLLVQFTDWELYDSPAVVEPISRALEAGVNMMSVVPRSYRVKRSALDQIMRACPVKAGKTTLIKYNRENPDAVWQQAAEVLG